MMYSNDRLLLANGRLALLDREVRLAGTGTAPSGGSPFLHTGGTR